MSYCRKSSTTVTCQVIALFLTLQFLEGVHCKSCSSPHRKSDLRNSALGVLPTPVNISVHSINFYHTLLWDPGPGTPLGTQYKIFQSIRGKKSELLNSTTTSLKLKLNYKKTYVFTVQASYNWTTSPCSEKVYFTPLTDTKIHPLDLSLAVCSNCLKINISLPKANPNSTVNDIQELYKPTFTVAWRKRNDKQSVNVTKQTKSFTLLNLEQGAEYCVQVYMKTNLNKNIDPSPLECILTSPAKSHLGLVLGVVSGLLLIFICILTFAFFSMPPFFWKKQVPKPKALTMALRQHQDTLTLEKTINDCLTITSEKENGKVRERQILSTYGAANTELNTQVINEGEENTLSLYQNRNEEPLLTGSCSVESDPVLGTNHPTLEKDFKERILKFSQAELKGEEPDAHFMYKSFHIEDQNTSEQNYEEINEDELWNNACNVNLLSVTLGAPVEGKRELVDGQNIEQDSTNFFPLNSMEPSSSLCYIKRTLTSARY